jgi:hypothetical protein
LPAPSPSHADAKRLNIANVLRMTIVPFRKTAARNGVQVLRPTVTKWTTIRHPYLRMAQNLPRSPARHAAGVQDTNLTEFVESFSDAHTPCALGWSRNFSSVLVERRKIPLTMINAIALLGYAWINRP